MPTLLVSSQTCSATRNSLADKHLEILEALNLQATVRTSSPSFEQMLIEIRIRETQTLHSVWQRSVDPHPRIAWLPVQYSSCTKRKMYEGSRRRTGFLGLACAWTCLGRSLPPSLVWSQDLALPDPPVTDHCQGQLNRID